MNVEEKLSRMAQIRKEIDSLTSTLQKELVLLEDDVKKEVLLKGDSFELDFVKVQIRRPNPKNSWDNKGLMGYSVVHPEILKFCETKNVQPNVALTWKV